MAKEVILLEYQLVEKGGDKVVSTVTDITEAWEKSGKAATAALSEKQIDSATAKLTTFNAQVEKTATGFTSAKSELRELEKIITSGKLQGNDLKQAVAQAAKLKDRIGDVRQEISRLSSDTRIFDTFVEGGRAVAAAFSVAQGAAALFGDENKDLQKSILKVQGALALLTGAQELANIVTKQGGLATQAYGVALKVVEGIQKAFAISAAASWAIATAGITLLVAGVASLIYYFNQADDAAEEATQHQNEFADSLKGTTREAANLRIELEKSKGNVSDISAQLQKNNNARQAAIEDANATEKELVSKLNAEIAKADGESLAKLLEERTKIRQEAEANRKAINQKFFLQDELALQESENRKRAIEKKAADDALKLRQQNKEIENIGKFEIEAKPVVREDIFVESIQQQLEPLIEKIPNVEIPVTINVEKAKNSLNELTEAQKKQMQEVIAFAQEAQNVINNLQGLANQLFENQKKEEEQRAQQQLEILNAAEEKAVQSAGDNAELRQKIQEKYAKQKEKIEKRLAYETAVIARKQAIANKAFAITSATINTALAVVSALATAPTIIAGIVMAALAAAAGVAAIATIAAQPLPPVPKFAKGVIGFKGKGTQTSDENLVMISNNESVMTGKATQKYNEELQAAQDLQLEDLIYHKYLLPALKQAGAADKDGNLYDDWMLRREVRANREADRQNSKYIVTGILTGMREQSYYTQRYYS